MGTDLRPRQGFLLLPVGIINPGAFTVRYQGTREAWKVEGSKERREQNYTIVKRDPLLKSEALS